MSAPLPIWRKDTLRSRLWHAARLQVGSFTVGDLVRLAAKDERCPEQGASLYLRALWRAGYLRRLPKRPLGDAGQGGAAPMRYALIRNTGPLSPKVSRDTARLYDPNSGEVFPCRT